MTDILRNLEPRAEPKDVILFYELDDFTEILFFNKGQCDIGFEINRKKHFVLRQRESIVIADHGCTFNHKSNFIYKTYTYCEGFSIRKEHWIHILKNYEDLAMQLKQRIIMNFFFKVKIKVVKVKRETIKRLSRRSDIHQILMVSEIDNGAEHKFLVENLKNEEVEQGSDLAKNTKSDSLISKEISFNKMLDRLEAKLVSNFDGQNKRIEQTNSLYKINKALQKKVAELELKNEMLVKVNDELQKEVDRLLKVNTHLNIGQVRTMLNTPRIDSSLSIMKDPSKKQIS